MNYVEDIINELQDLSTVVAAVPQLNVFTVDEFYFITLQQEIMSKINGANSFIPPENFTVPAGYFEGLAGSILHKIYSLENDASAELKEISPTLANIESKETYSVPADYFKNLTVLNKQKESAKIMAINKKRSFFKYAAAAVITALLGLSIVNIVHKNDTENTFKKTADTITTILLPNSIAIKGNFDDALQNISGNEIEQYLQKSGQDVDAALVASSTDDIDKLPEATDYLLNENVLEDYLKENNLNN